MKQTRCAAYSAHDATLSPGCWTIRRYGLFGHTCTKHGRENVMPTTVSELSPGRKRIWMRLLSASHQNEALRNDAYRAAMVMLTLMGPGAAITLDPGARNRAEFRSMAWATRKKGR